MIHQRYLAPNFGRNGEYQPDQARYVVNDADLFDASDPAYQQGGWVLNVQTLPRVEGDDYWSLIICDRASCPTCILDQNRLVPTRTQGLPLVHSKFLNNASGHRRIYRDEVLDTTRWMPSGTEEVDCTLALVRFIQPAGDDGADTPTDTLVEVAICNPASCEECEPESPVASSDNDTTMASPVREYKIASLNDSRFNIATNRFEYEVYWEGLPDDQASWEPIGNVVAYGDFDAVRDFHQSFPNFPKPSRNIARRHGVSNIIG